MAAPPLMRSLSTRTVKKLEKPRPLKTSASQTKIASEPSPQVPLQDLMILVENVSQCLIDKNYNESLFSNIEVMNSKMKIHGPQLETIFKDQLDRAFVIFRNGCQDNDLYFNTRLHLLQLVELRANQWSNTDNSQIYYSAKMATEVEPITVTPDTSTTTSVPMSTPSPPAPPVLSPGEVLKTSGKFPKPTKVVGKNYCKDEVVIRNSDSGKVMGIKGRRVHMIEELSETIISFQRVNPGAKERLVQITGPSEEKIVHARQLMEDTIRRNASPVREGGERERMCGSSSSLNSSASDESNRLHQGSRRSTLLHSFSTNDASLGEYKYTVTLGHDTVKITGSNHETVRNARLVLEEYYNTWIQKNCMGDCYGLDEDVFMDPSQEMSMLQLNSLDSGNGNGPSTSSGDSDDITCISTVSTSAVSGLDPSLSYQALYPLVQPERRAVLGRSDSIPLSSLSPTQAGVCRKYSREFLLECAFSHHSRVTPPNWEQITQLCPAIVKKAASPFDPRAFAKRVAGSVTSVISATQTNNDPDSD